MSRTLSALAAAMLAACGGDLLEPTSATLQLRTITTGAPIDPDGYSARVDGGQGTALGVNATLSVPDLTPGEHEVELSGVAPNCLVAEPNPRRVTMSAGVVTPARFDVLCSTPPGSLEIAVTTSGDSPDTDGYLLRLDGGTGVPVPSTGTVRYASVVPGEHEVRLVGLAPNCAVVGDNPRRVPVASDAVRVDFEVRCVPPTGAIAITTTTGGARPDVDGYVVTISGAERPIPSNGTLTISGLPPGEILVQLGGIAANCQVEGDNPRPVSVTNGGWVPVTFDVTCRASGEGILLFTSDRSGSSHLYRIRDDGTDLRDLTPSFEATSGDWSPDGTRIVFSADRPGGPELFVMDEDGSHRVALGVAGADPRWSPDGTKILYTNAGTVTVMNADGTGSTPLAEGYAGDWSPDGGRIAFSRVDRSRCIYDMFCPTDLYVMEADGTGVTLLVSATNSSDDLTGAAWSPDGTKLAYTRFCCFLDPAWSGVYVVSTRGTPIQRIDQVGPVGSGPLWSPDGSSIAVAVRQLDGTTELTLMPSGGGPGVVLASSPESEFPQAWR